MFVERGSKIYHKQNLAVKISGFAYLGELRKICTRPHPQQFNFQVLESIKIFITFSLLDE